MLKLQVAWRDLIKVYDKKFFQLGMVIQTNKPTTKVSIFLVEQKQKEGSFCWINLIWKANRETNINKSFFPEVSNVTSQHGYVVHC